MLKKVKTKHIYMYIYSIWQTLIRFLMCYIYFLKKLVCSSFSVQRLVQRNTIQVCQ